MRATWRADMADRMPASLVASIPLCHFLARLFIAAPDAALLQDCRRGTHAALLAECAADPELAAGAIRLSLALDTEDATAVSRAWMLLFSGAGGPATVAPYASAYEEGRLYGAATSRMRAVLARLDLAVAADCHEPADHIAIQLSVFALLLSSDELPAAEEFR